MEDPGSVGPGYRPAERVAGVPARGRAAVAASILGVLLIAAYLVAAPGGIRPAAGEYLVNAAVLAVAFWFPAMRVASVGDVVRQWMGFALWILVWALAWDLATSGIFLRRELFSEWWVVYPAALVTLFGLLLLHGAVMGRVVRRAPGAPGPPPV
jgi:hypothetical protein